MPKGPKQASTSHEDIPSKSSLLHLTIWPVVLPIIYSKCSRVLDSVCLAVNLMCIGPGLSFQSLISEGQVQARIFVERFSLVPQMLSSAVI